MKMTFSFHKSLIRTSFPLLIGLCGLLAPVSGQNELTSIQTNFSAVSWQKPLPEPVYVRSRGEMVELRIHSMRRSEEVDYNGLNPVTFHVKREDAEGQDSYPQIAEIEIGSEMKQPLLFFIEEEGVYRVIALEDSFDVYPLGSYRFYNFTENDLLAKMDDEAIHLEPRNTVYLKKPIQVDKEYPIVFVVREPDGLKPLYRNIWTHSGNYRYLILISESKSRDLSPIKFNILADSLPTDGQE